MKYHLNLHLFFWQLSNQPPSINSSTNCRSALHPGLQAQVPSYCPFPYLWGLDCCEGESHRRHVLRCYVLSVLELGGTLILQKCVVEESNIKLHTFQQRPGLPFLPCLPCHPSWQVACRAYFWQEPVWICHILSRCAKKSRRKCVQITNIFWLLLAITLRKRFYKPVWHICCATAASRMHVSPNVKVRNVQDMPS